MDPQPNRDWSDEAAQRERVPPRVCLCCGRPREELPAGTALKTTETQEVLCTECIERMREVGRTKSVMVVVSDHLEAEESEVVEDLFRQLTDYVEGDSNDSMETIISEASEELDEA